MDVKINKDEVRTQIKHLLSDMLDNPDDSGIYPTTKFMKEAEAYIISTWNVLEMRLIQVEKDHANLLKSLEYTVKQLVEIADERNELRMTLDSMKNITGMRSNNNEKDHDHNS